MKYKTNDMKRNVSASLNQWQMELSNNLTKRNSYFANSPKRDYLIYLLVSARNMNQNFKT